jgi:hypothetical protein
MKSYTMMQYPPEIIQLGDSPHVLLSNSEWSTPDDVANIVLTSISSKNPNLGYLVGRDIEEWVKSKNSMTDAEFHDMMMKGMSN